MAKIPDSIGTPLKSSAVKVMMLGSGELGKEVVIEFQRFGVEVIAVDRYDDAPAMQVAHRSYTISMLDEKALRDLIHKEKPHFIVPEVEAIATHVLVDLEKEGFTVIPSAKAAQLTMNREGIRQLAAEQLKLKTSPYRFAGTKLEFQEAVKEIGIPCVVKPIMSSSGKGQSVVRSADDIDKSWTYAQEGGRAGGGRVIVEGFVKFDYEITLLTVRHKDGISFCAPIGHRQENGDYRESWQPHPMSDAVLKKAQQMAGEVVNALGGRGIFGVEFFIAGETVYFSELSPRPHDTGMVTLISQDLSEFALHVRAILGLPIPNIDMHGPSASAAVLVHGSSSNVSFSGLDEVLSQPDTQLRLFGKPEVQGERRMGVCLARGSNIDEAKRKAIDMVNKIKVTLSVLLVGFLASLLTTDAIAQTATAPTASYRVPMFENDEVKVWKTVIVPKSPLSMHRHEHGRTIVVLKGGKLTIVQDTGERKIVDWETGKAYWLDADPPGDKKHADVNETEETIEVMVIENKKK